MVICDVNGKYLQKNEKESLYLVLPLVAVDILENEITRPRYQKMTEG